MRHILILIFTTLTFLSVSAQSYEFSQLNSNLYFMNSAFGGADDYSSFGIVNKTEPLLSVPFITNGIYYNQLSETLRGAFGISYIDDRIGKTTGADATFKQSNINISYSYNLRINNKYNIVMSLQGGYHRIPSLIGNSHLPININYGPEVLNRYLGANRFDMNAGLLLYDSNNIFSFSVDNLFLKNKDDYYINLVGDYEQLKFNFLYQSNIEIGDKYQYYPYIVFKLQDSFYHMAFGTNVRYSNFMFGASYLGTFNDSDLNSINIMFLVMDDYISYGISAGTRFNFIGTDNPGLSGEFITKINLPDSKNNKKHRAIPSAIF